MVEEQTMVRIIAASSSKEGDYVVEDADGTRRLFIGSTGALSRGQLNEDFLAALLRGPNWHTVSDDRWYSLRDLQAQAAYAQGGQSARRRRRMVPAFGNR